MKKILLLVFSALICAGVSARDFNVTSGKTTCMKDKGATAIVKIDFTGCTWENEMTLEEFSGEEYAERAVIALDNFIIGFNDSTKGLKVSAADDNAKYLMTVHITNMDRKQAGSAFVWGQMCLKFAGEVTVVDIATGENVCTIEIDGYKGQRGDFVPNDRIVKGFNELGWKIATLK
jgi:hypothetical protein